MNNWGYFMGVFILLVGCGTPHPITEVQNFDVSESAPNLRADYLPAELLDSLGWGTLSSPELENINEEFRIVLTSGSLPYHLFRITNKKSPEGEAILFWPKEVNSVNALEPQKNMEQFLKGTCAEILETPNYAYCTPKISGTINWSANYNMLVNNNIWTIPDESEMEVEAGESSNPWQIHVQTRYQQYYREYAHTNPDQYGSNGSALNVLAIAARMRMVANTFSPPQNFNIYQGITSGIRGSEFIPCGTNERWRFNAGLAELLSKSGTPASIQQQDSLLFYINVQATVKDEWYAQRESTGFAKVITPTEINSFQVVSTQNCPNGF